ncbi:ABC transporter ATP-binding protein [Pedobacter yulinensis]|uniref:ABC transporter ATP-binding protein n=1 Tax=Pedobacter yulinensis TaxID=2126353 RepID=A0A2T3HIV7_9SPHI|nr:ABC transporter ATP-binding protein [Pedobacter yulinensis]PST82374.1 ABC transporter ATP-binding protein [Pedobacter yulinensis]
MIQLSNISFAYSKGRPVLENLDLVLQAGHIYGLLGLNGAGKSSLLYQIAGLLFPDHGTARVLGMEPAQRSIEFLQSVYLLPEQSAASSLSAISYAAVHGAFYPAFDQEHFSLLLKQFDVDPRRPLDAMSYGQAKKAMIAFAIATRVRIILMDEPTNGLDIPSKRQFRKVIAGALQEDQLMVISTHQVRDLDNLIDYLLVLKDRNVILNASADHITSRILFRNTMDPQQEAGLLYAEGGLKGYAVLLKNTHGHDSKLDTETFFNALLTEKEAVLAVLNQNPTNHGILA